MAVTVLREVCECCHVTLYYALPPRKLKLVGGVHQGQLLLLLEEVDHVVDLLPHGPRDPLGAGLGQHVLHGGKSERI